MRDALGGKLACGKQGTIDTAENPIQIRGRAKPAGS